MSNRARRNLDEEMQRLTFSRAGVSPTRIDHQIRAMEASNSSMTSRLSLLEGTMQTQQGLLEDAFSQLRTARAENRDLQARLLTRTQDHTCQIQILSQQNENLRNVHEAQISHLRQEHTGHIQQLNQQQQREMTELRTTLTQTFNQEKQAMQSQHQMSLEAAQRHHQVALETTQRQADMTKQRELFEQSGRAKQEKDDAIRELQQKYEAKLQRKQEEHDTQIAIVKGYLESSKEILRKKEQEFAEKLGASQREITTRDQSLARLEADIANKQSAIDQLLETTESQTKEITDMKAETQRNIRYFLEEQLGQQTDRRLNELRAEHETRAQEAHAQWQAENFGLDALIEQLQDSLGTATERYENRDSLPQDVEKIEELETRLQQEEQQNEQLQERIAELSDKIEELEQERGSMVQACQDMSTYPFIPQTVGMNSEAQHYGEYNLLHSQGDNQQFQDYDENYLQNMNIEDGGLNGLQTQSQGPSWQMMSQPDPHTSSHCGQQGASRQQLTPALQQLLENQQESGHQQAYQDPHASKEQAVFDEEQTFKKQQAFEEQQMFYEQPTSELRQLTTKSAFSGVKPKPKTTNIVIAEQPTTAEKKLILQEAKLLQNIAELKSERDNIKDALETMEVKRREEGEEFQEKLNQMTSKLENQEAVRLEEKNTLEQALLEQRKVQQKQTTEITRLTGLFKQKEESISALTQKVDGLEEEKKAGMQAMKELETLTRQLETEQSSREQEKQKLEQTLKEQREAQENQRKQILALEERRIQYEEERERLNQKLVALKQKEKNNAWLKEKLSNLTSQLESERTVSQQEKRQLEESLKEQQENLQRQTQHIAELKERVRKYEDERVNLDKELVTLKQKEENNARLVEDFSHLASQLESERTVSQQEKHQLEKLLDSKQMELEDLNDRNIQLDELLQTNEAAKEDLQEKNNAELKEKLSNLTSQLESERTAKQQEKRQLEESLKEQRENLQRQTQHIAELKERVRKYEDERVNLDKELVTLKQKEENSAELEEELSNITSRLDSERTASLQEKRQLEESLLEQRKVQQKQTTEITRLTGLFKQKEESISALTQKVDALEDEEKNNAELKEKLSNLTSQLESERTAKQQEKRQLEESLKEQRENLQRQTQHIAELKERVRKYEDERVNLNKELVTLKQKNQLDGSKIREDKLKSTLGERQLDLHELGTKNGQMQEEVDKTAIESKEMKRRDTESGADEVTHGDASEPTSPGGTTSIDSKTDPEHSIRDDATPPAKDKTNLENLHTESSPLATEETLYQTNLEGNNAQTGKSFGNESEEKKLPKSDDKIDSKQHNLENSDSSDATSTLMLDKDHERKQPHATLCTEGQDNSRNTGDSTAETNVMMDKSCDRSKEMGASTYEENGTISNSRKPLTTGGKCERKPDDQITSDSDNSHLNENPDTVSMQHKYIETTDCTVQESNTSPEVNSPHRSLSNEHSTTTKSTVDNAEDKPIDNVLANENRTGASAKPASMVAEKTSGKPDAPASKPNQTSATGNTESGQQTSGKSRKKIVLFVFLFVLLGFYVASTVF